MSPSPALASPVEAKTPSNGHMAKFWKIVNFIKEQWIILGFAFACVMAYLFPCKSHPLNVMVYNPISKS